MIYDYVIDMQQKRLDRSPSATTRSSFPKCLGDPGGFLFPVRTDPCLRACSALRADILPFIYRRTTYIVQNTRQAVQLLLGIGTIGRRNLRGLDLGWSGTDRGFDHQPPPPWTAESELSLVLLAECTQLKFLRLRLNLRAYSGHISDFQKDPGVQELLRLRPLNHVEISDICGERLPLDERILWLENTLTRPMSQLERLSQLKLS